MIVCVPIQSDKGEGVLALSGALALASRLRRYSETAGGGGYGSWSVREGKVRDNRVNGNEPRRAPNHHGIDCAPRSSNSMQIRVALNRWIAEARNQSLLTGQGAVPFPPRGVYSGHASTGAASPTMREVTWVFSKSRLRASRMISRLKKNRTWILNSVEKVTGNQTPSG